MTKDEADQVSEERGLTWSKKWHIINPDHQHVNGPSKYAIARCGAYLYRNDDPKYPNHLKMVRDGQMKDTGLCKLCAKSAKITTPTDALARVVEAFAAVAAELREVREAIDGGLNGD